MNGLAIKDVEFNGAIIRAAQDLNNIIWIGVRWICEGIGFNDDRIKYERKKIQKDLVLSQGVKFFPLGSGNSNSEVLCLMLDYLPLWLAKISITPTMQKENPILVEKLIEYQLKAKDVLAAAFFSKKEDIIPAEKSNMIQLQFPDVPDYTNDFVTINNKIDKLYSDMGKLANIIIGMKEASTTQIVSNETRRDLASEWKHRMYNLMDQLIDSGKYKEKADIMKYIYRYMNKNYGICWDQDIKNYKNDLGYKPSTIDIVYINGTYRSIFESVLSDLVGNKRVNIVTEYYKTDEIIKPLIDKMNDKSNAGMITYKAVYKKMDDIATISWNNREARYINRYGNKNVNKKNIINSSKSLLKIFEAAVNKMMEEK